ncbi:MAG: heme o synthase [Acidobacteriota bacterium]|nr:heme o synthase [Acidobacteriota bacterium]
MAAVGEYALAPAPARSAWAWRDYVTLTKPRIMSLLVLTAACAMIAAAAGNPDIVRLLALVIGGGLACGSASTLNHVLDRDIDQVMGERTASRPVASGRVSPASAVVYAAILAVASFAIMVTLDNLLAALLALAGGSFYVVVYTLGLKRRTSENIVIGGAAGAIPVLSGWAAASGHLAAGAWYLFVIVLVWTPPHFWSLAVLLEDHYRAADVPMLPVVKGRATTARRVLLYTILTVAVTLLPGVTGTFGAVYVACAGVLGAIFTGLAWRLWRSPTRERAAVTFHYSLLYLALLFVAVAVGAAV